MHHSVGPQLLDDANRELDPGFTWAVLMQLFGANAEV